MLHFGRIFDGATRAEVRRLDQFQALFRTAFPREAEEAERLRGLIGRRHELSFDVLLLTAEEERAKVLGFAYAYVFPDIRYAFLDYIASDPRSRHRGLGSALYEALRETLEHRKLKGLFLECPPDEADRVSDASRIETNQARVRFYERYGATPIVGSGWDDPPEPLGYDAPLLVFDSLGRPRKLPRADARKTVQAILGARYRRSPEDPFTRTMVASFRDDPVRLREPRYGEGPQDTLSAPRTQHLKPLTLIVPERHEIHHVRERGYVERPARVGAILRALESLPFSSKPARHVGESAIRAVHDGNYVSYLATCTATLGENETLYPQVFPIRRPDRKPKEAAMRAGYYCIDTFTPLSRSAYRAARAAVSCAVTGAEAVLGGDHLVYAACRPPGHHAERRVYGGFCYFNNAAIAANLLSREGKVALLDVDYHHGNGQQDIFYERDDVFTLSIHGHPREHYPYFSGYADERGSGVGLRYNRNVPVRGEPGDAAYLEILAGVLEEVRRFRPDWFVIALGFDTMRGDPTGNFALSPSGMRKLGEACGKVGLPTLVVQEGGYSLRNLKRGAHAFFGGLASTWYG